MLPPQVGEIGVSVNLFDRVGETCESTNLMPQPDADADADAAVGDIGASTILLNTAKIFWML